MEEDSLKNTNRKLLVKMIGNNFPIFCRIKFQTQLKIFAIQNKSSCND